MRGASDSANVCYMNFSDSGQAIEQALMGFEFDDASKSEAFTKWLENGAINYEIIPMETIRHLGQSDQNGVSGFSADFIRPA